METNNIDKIHKEVLGFEIPEDYFEKSKNEILSKIIKKKEVRKISFFNRKFVLLAAAGIALLFSLTIYIQQTIGSINNIPTIVLDSINLDKNSELIADYFVEDDILINSLFVSDNDLETYLNDAFINDVSADENIDDFIVDELMPDNLF